MKYIAGFVLALITTVLFLLVNKFVFNYAIPEFLIGWLACTVNFFVVDIYDEIKKKD